jgi:isopenicillin N synthase-like dioxygenase
MKLLAKGLGLSPDYFAGRFEGEPTCLFRVFNYPKGLSDGSSWGVGPHTDMGFLTILAPGEQGGLQVKGRDGEFFDVHPIEGAFVLNIGDMLEYWTGGIYKATVHRVTNTADEDRLSFPFFFDPAWNANLLPIPNELLSAEDLSLVSADVKDRWDGLNLKELSSSLTYGEFVWDKIKDVFPQLSGSLK